MNENPSLSFGLAFCLHLSPEFPPDDVVDKEADTAVREVVIDRRKDNMHRPRHRNLERFACETIANSYVAPAQKPVVRDMVRCPWRMMPHLYVHPNVQEGESLCRLPSEPLISFGSRGLQCPA